jgi:hypothetical protein
MTANFPAPGTTVCGCDEDAACNYHAPMLYDIPTPAVDTAAQDEQRQFLDATADFYIPGWTPDDEDAREFDRKILADIGEEILALAKRDAQGWNH